MDEEKEREEREMAEQREAFESGALIVLNTLLLTISLIARFKGHGTLADVTSFVVCFVSLYYVINKKEE